MTRGEGSKNPEFFSDVICASPLIWTGDSVMGQLEIYSSGPFGSDHTGEWFSDWWQSLDGHTVKPQHWPDQINIRAGGRIDA